MEQTVTFMWTEASGTDWKSMAVELVENGWDEPPTGKKWAILRSDLTPWHQGLPVEGDKFPGVYRVTAELGFVDDDN